MLESVAEACDDGNTTGNDGCSASCTVEPGAECQLLPGTLRSTCDVCGNGLRRLSEGCDDGNLTSEDGCTSECELEPNYYCPDPGGVPCSICGNGIRVGREACDDGNTASDDGCSSDCSAIEENWNCPVVGVACEQCGNGTVDAHEVCDDGMQCSDGGACTTDADCASIGDERCEPRDGDGCRSDCLLVEPTWFCVAGGACTQCGNGIVDAGEQCDDGNSRDTDGCSECQTLAGWNCFVLEGSTRSTCDRCGNRVVRGNEGCDDGNTAAGDGCNSGCQPETASGWVCPGAGGPCRNCGDGILQPEEACDPGSANLAAGGCINGCTEVDTANGWACPEPNEPCERCGNSEVDNHEVCDDGGTSDSDGCRGDCRQIEEGWFCTGGLDCTQCGNGVVNAGEDCDDGNFRDGDGCDACVVTAGWTCAVREGSTRSSCSRCGDRVVGGTELCDNGSQCEDNTTSCSSSAQCSGIGTGTCSPRNGDGCSNTCLEVEGGYSCAPNGGPCYHCGNGDIEPGEACDEGVNDGIGCINDCSAIDTADGWHCPVEGAQCLQCGNGDIDTPYEACDDGGRADGDGCSADCRRIEDEWLCSVDSSGTSVCMHCGDGVLDTLQGEECDDGNYVTGDGCSACSIDEWWDCVEDTEGLSTCEHCGDRNLGGSETCDNGKHCPSGTACTSDADCGGVSGDCQPRSGDGCSASCSIESGAGYLCNAAGTLCYVCGNGEVEPGEACDEGDDADGSGCIDNCSAINTAEGWHCPAAGVACVQCGNGTVDAPYETCDDGARAASDGCSASCQIEQGFVCTATAPTTCTRCGNRIVDSAVGETCDDGNSVPGDGCDASCHRETSGYYNCATAGLPCEQCGNGQVEPNEGCDDGWHCADGTTSCESDAECVVAGACDTVAGHCAGNTTACTTDADCAVGECRPRGGDGCDVSCDLEAGWDCPVPGAPCNRCGNGEREGAEQCDNGMHCSNSNECATDADCVVAGACNLATHRCPNGVTVCSADAECAVGDCRARAGDGCSATCRLEPGWVCDETGCSSQRCGDGVAADSETCDDGGYCTHDSSIPCSNHSDCTETGTCVFSGGTGGSIGAGTCDHDPDVTCDDDADCAQVHTCDFTPRGGDGCSIRCTVEEGFICPEAGGTCQATRCGDYVVSGTEQCDDGMQCENGVDCLTAADCASIGSGTCAPRANNGSCSSTATTPCLVDANCPPTETCTPTAPQCDELCYRVSTCGDGILGRSGGVLEECDDAGAADNGCEGCAWLTGWACTGSAPVYTCTNPGANCGDGIRTNTEACDDHNTLAGDGCAADCTVESLFTCSGDPGETSTCAPLFQWVVVRPFSVSSIDPVGVHYVPETRSFVGYKSQDTQNILELCLDGTLINHPARQEPGAICPPYPASCTSYTRSAWPIAEGVREYPVAYGGLTGSTYDAISGTWFFLDAATLYRVEYLPRLGQTPDAVAFTLSGTQIDGATGITIGDDGRMYVAIQRSSGGYTGIRAFSRLEPDTGIGFDFSTAARPDIWDDEWLVSGSDNLNGIVNLAGFNAVAILTDSPSDGDSNSDLRAFNIHCTAEDEQSFGESSIPGALFAQTDIYGNNLSALNTAYATGGFNFPLTNAGDGMEASTDGSGFIACVETASQACYLFAQVCDDDSDCVSGATCQSGNGINYCASPGKARDDFSNTSLGATVPIDVLANDTRSQGTCRDSTFDLVSVGESAYGATVEISDDVSVCGGSAPCVIYTPPLNRCNLIDTFEYTVNVGGGEAPKTASVHVVVSCACGNAVVDDGEECDPSAPSAPANCSTTCTLIPVCGNDTTEGTETCDDGNTSSGDGCSWDCRVEGCGNRVIDGTEECDDGNTVAGDRCAPDCHREYCGDGVVNRDYTTGLLDQCDNGGYCSLSTSVNCATDADCPTDESCTPVGGDGCSATCVREPICGDGIPEGSEQCDDQNTSNTDACVGTCQLAYCGDTYTRSGVEECDDGDNDSGDGCSWDCKLEVCGNARLDAGEDCDDPNNASCVNCQLPECGNGTIEAGEECDGSAGCTNCILTAGNCGNGILEIGEECDPGSANISNEAACRPGCILARCGDGATGPGEECDDGNTVTDANCSWDCQNVGCGNGVIDGSEECDDGAEASGDGCSRDCLWERCGNGIRDVDSLGAFVEECDDGNLNDLDSCDRFCLRTASCGNGVVEGAEECDNGDQNNEHGECLPVTCTWAYCGDGNLLTAEGSPEQCDDGNTISGDDCSWNCMIEECGDGKLDVGEACDDGNVANGDGCSGLCTLEGCGNGRLDSGEACDPSVSGTTGCRTDCTRMVCGDGIVDPGEACDDRNTTNGDGCSATCTVESIALCGDGHVDAGEACDDGDLISGDGCSSSCTNEVCGNGFVDVGEQCDDGNTSSEDGCRAATSTSPCTIPRCGDGIRDTFRGEQCDDGNTASGDGCNAFCLTEARCGDRRVDAGEQCDDGNTTSGDGCSSTCTFEGCGNGVKEPSEACDPSAPNPPAGCRFDCTLAACGDGIFDAGEQCDDHNTTSGDGCSSTCTLETVCGNGIRESTEQCDDGNNTNGDRCSSVCRYEYCGNGTRDVNASGAFTEECDDGNNASGDGCSSVCTEEPVCGDSVREGAEQCDDGNTTSGDGCSRDCRTEAYCGDGKVDPGEQCDPRDPNTAANCTANCTILSVT